MRDQHSAERPRPLRIPVSDGWLHADLARPNDPGGLVIFLHGSGNIRHTPHRRDVARKLERRRLATLPVDLLTEEEEEVDRQLGHLRFDIARLGRRAIEILDWLDRQPGVAGLRVGLFGATTGAAAALVAAAERPARVSAVVSMGGRPDLAGPALTHVAAPTLLLVGSRDEPLVDMNRYAERRMPAVAELEIVPGVADLLDDPGSLERAAERSADWFGRYVSEPRGVPETAVRSADTAPRR